MLVVRLPLLPPQEALCEPPSVQYIIYHWISSLLIFCVILKCLPFGKLLAGLYPVWAYIPFVFNTFIYLYIYIYIYIVFSLGDHLISQMF